MSDWRFDGCSLQFQDLLQMQYEGVAVMKMFDKVKVNVNLLIYLLNKKFYGKWSACRNLLDLYHLDWEMNLFSIFVFKHDWNHYLYTRDSFFFFFKDQNCSEECTHVPFWSSETAVEWYTKWINANTATLYCGIGTLISNSGHSVICFKGGGK